MKPHPTPPTPQPAARLSSAQRAVRESARWTIAGAALGAVALGAWAALSPLAAAVVADGTVKASGNRKTVVHAEGGIVDAIHVKDGDTVQAGQTLITLADQRVAASADSLRQQWVTETLKAKRLEAESTGSAFPILNKTMGTAASPVRAELVEVLKTIPPALEAHIHTSLQREQAVYSARAHQQAEQAHWLGAQLAQVRAEIDNDAQIISSTQSAQALAQRELANNEKLQREGFVSEAKLIELQRSVADYRARVQTAQAQRSQAQQKEADLQQRLSAQKADFARQAADELKDTAQKRSQITQELRPALDAQTRQRITAPVAGEVVDLKVYTLGSAIAPREAVLDIAPSGAALVVEVRINPSDIHDVRAVWLDKTAASSAMPVTQAHVMLPAYRARSTPQVEGTVAYVGADRLTDPATRAPYYIAHIAVSQAALNAASRLAGQPISLQAGMQAEVFIPTQARSAWRYLLDPLIDGVRRSMRER
jgi:membrane fusion protein, epimerase transport system